jgi:hypothetical protein
MIDQKFFSGMFGGSVTYRSSRRRSSSCQLPDQLAHLAIFREKREFFLNFFTNCKKVVANVPPDFIRPVISGNGR